MKKSSSNLWVSVAMSILLIALCCNPAFAITSSNNSIESMVDLFRDHTAVWQSALRGYALQLFWLLALIQFCWAAVRLALKNADFSEWVSEIVRQIFFIGFFLTLLMNSSSWATAIVNSFRTAADSASSAAGGVTGISPSNLFNIGLQLGTKIMGQFSFYNPATSVSLIICALIVVVCFGLITAHLIVALVESYFVISAGVLFMGFGGSQWTSDYALKTLNYAVSVGAKLFVLQLIVGLGESLAQSWVNSVEVNDADIFTLVGSAIIFLALTKMIPEMIQGLINGSSVSSGASLMNAGVGVGAAMLAPVAYAFGAHQTANGAGKLASEQLTSADEKGEAPESKAGRFAFLTGNAAKNTWDSATSELGQRFRGETRSGNPLARMGHAMTQKAEHMADNREKPQEPATAGNSSNGNGLKNTIEPQDD